MANAILKVAPDEVRAKAQQIQSERDKMQQLMQDIQTEVSKLPNDSWKSQSGTDYNSQYGSASKNLDGALNTLMLHINNLVEAANQYDTIESEQARIVQELDTQNIFN